MKDPVLLVLADECDSAAAAFVARHRGEGARLLAPADLSSPGWSYRVGDASNSVAMVAGERIAAEQLGGVMTRLAGISPAHLPHVVEADREYVAAEMSAFLLAWLSALPCPVWNRPAAPSLSGPAWRWEQWRQLATQAGLNVAPSHRVVQREAQAAAPAPATSRCSVVGSKVIGTASARRRHGARRLAEAAGVELLELLFDGDDDDATLVGIGLHPNVEEPSISAAVIEGWHS
ncbi:hypothetical protein WKW80_09770 [Variovorax humicola]|uniref:Uncharacterized protein n=1 Tax=Variovorax humicola TaxID=1769758 RepID=A0ABU8VWY0_9BURK